MKSDPKAADSKANSSQYSLLESIPTHVAIIMDGNGRWARARGLPRLAGHRAGVENIRQIIRAANDYGIKYLTIYAFSTENWSRPKGEVQGLMSILEEVIDTETDELHRNGVQIRHIGQQDQLSPILQKKLRNAIELTKDNNNLILIVAWNYGGRDEIIHAIKGMMADGIKPEEVSQDIFGRYLYTAGCPDPDLIIRTSGELRVSNFLIWQGAYSEYYVTDTYWPDFKPEELRGALVEYAQRERRFGRVGNTTPG